SHPSCFAPRFAAARMCATEVATSSAISSAVKAITCLPCLADHCLPVDDLTHRARGSHQINHSIREDKFANVVIRFQVRIIPHASSVRFTWFLKVVGTGIG